MSRAALIATISSSTSCSAAGFGIGSSIPKYVSEIPARWTSELEARKAGDHARLRTTGSSAWLEGEYRGDRDGDLVLVTAAGERCIPYADITELEIRRGTHWQEGLAAGIALDVLAVALVASMASGPQGVGVPAR